MAITISQINIFSLPQRDTLWGFANFVVNDCLRISGVGLHTDLKGRIKLIFPAKKLGASYQFYVQPTDSETYEIIRKVIEEKAKELGLFSFRTF